MPGVGFEPTRSEEQRFLRAPACTSWATRAEPNARCPATLRYTSVVARILYAPFSVIGSLIAGLLAKKVFEQAWALVDDEGDGPPEAKEQDAPVVKLVIGAVLQAGVFAAVRVLCDRYARRAFYGLFGTWPGEKPGA